MSSAGRSALIGVTGFVGSNLAGQAGFDDTFHRTDIDAIRGRRFRLIVCAGAPAAKWIANREPDEDRRNIELLMGALASVHADEFVLVSTIDVYAHPVGVTEFNGIGSPDPYGAHRYDLELLISARFPDHRIVRLPGLFGPGLRKNVIYDLLNDNNLDKVDPWAIFQWYDINLLWNDIGILRRTDVRLLNLATEPLPTRVIIERLFPGVVVGRPATAPPNYDMQTTHAEVFRRSGPYCYSQTDMLTRLTAFVRAVKGGSVKCGSPYQT